MNHFERVVNPKICQLALLGFKRLWKSKSKKIYATLKSLEKQKEKNICNIEKFGKAKVKKIYATLKTS